MKLKGALIEYVVAKSICDEVGIRLGEYLLSINDIPVRDMIDYQMLMADEELKLQIRNVNGECRYIEIEKDYDTDLGLLFASAVFDGMGVCRNKCLFCFVDQMPKGYRKTLYVKDDDYRMSFLYGNYITLTNLSDADFNRIINEKISPLYISIHATNQDIRNRLLGISEEVPILEKLRRLVDNGISLHGQIVLVPGINDGDVLEDTINSIRNMVPQIESLAVVPVGLTKYQKNSELRRFTVDEGKAVIESIHNWQTKFMKDHDTSFVFASDELYLQAECDIPNDESYEYYAQIENGVGLIRMLWETFDVAKEDLPMSINDYTKIYLITGIDGEKALIPIIKYLNNINNIDVSPLTVVNNFFGNTVTVTGLLTGNDIINGILEQNNKDAIYILPSVVLKHGENKLLDDILIDDIIRKTEVDLRVIDPTADDLVSVILSLERK